MTREEQIKETIAGNVCDGCGGELSVLLLDKETAFEQWQPGCKTCSKITWGVTPDMYQFGRWLVMERHVRYYSDPFLNKCETGTDEERAYWMSEQVSNALREFRRMKQYEREYEELQLTPEQKQ